MQDNMCGLRGFLACACRGWVGSLWARRDHAEVLCKSGDRHVVFRSGAFEAKDVEDCGFD